MAEGSQTPRMPEGSQPAAREGDEQRRGRRGRRDRHRERRPDQGAGPRPQLTGLPADAFEQDHAAGEAAPFPAKAPDVAELRRLEREMHLAQMRAEAQAREDAARQEREARGEVAGQARDADEAVKREPVPAAALPVEPKPAAMHSMEPRPEPTQPVAQRPAPAQSVQPRPVATPAETPRVDTREMLESAGLQMVETRADKAPVTPPAEEPVQLGRPRRERPRPAGEEPLVQVETKN